MDFSRRIANIEEALRITFTHSQRVQLQRFFAEGARSKRGEKVVIFDGLLLISTSPGGRRYTVHHYIEAFDSPMEYDELPYWFGHWEGYGVEPLTRKRTKIEKAWTYDPDSSPDNHYFTVVWRTPILSNEGTVFLGSS